MDRPAPLPEPGLAGRRILIVDDDRVNRRILEQILKAEEYALAEAESGERALELYPGFQPDLVLLDVMLAGIDGLETCRTLQKRFGPACAPVIFITAKNESDDVVKGFAAGGVDYLPKPFQAREVVARIGTHLRNRLLADQLKEMVGKLSAANAAKNKVLGVAAHDLRNPLASIRGLAEFLSDGTVGEMTEEQLDLVNTIYSASQSMLELVNEIVDIATIESGELKLQLGHHNLSELVEKSVAQASLAAVRKQTRIELAPHSRGATARIDAARMKQVVDHLLSNAVKYSPPGSTIAVLVDSDPARCGIAVRDQGPGIPEAERDRLFRSFGRLSVKPTGGETSTGLGLAICRKIVEAHDGAIVAENLPGRGCEFRVSLPVST